MASIQKINRKSGPGYRVFIRRKGHEPITATFPRKKEAEKFAREVEGDFHKYAAMLGGELRRHTLADLIDRYMGQWIGKDQSLITRLAWWKDNYGDRRLAEFTTATAKEGLSRLKTEPALRGGYTIGTKDSRRSPATVNRYLSAISVCFRTAKAEGWYGIEQNPAAGLSRGKERSRFGRKLEDDERVRLLAACDESAWAGLGVLVRLAIATGGRRGELLGLEWKDVDLKTGKVLFRDTKNGEDRAVPVIGSVIDLLRQWGKVRRLDSTLVFPSSKDPTTPPDLEWFWNKAKASAGIENLRFHDLRHSTGSYLAQAGASAFQIAAVLGHRSGPGLTARYVHLVAEDSRDLLEGALGGVLGE